MVGRWTKSDHPGLTRRNPVRRTAAGSRLRVVMGLVGDQQTDLYTGLDTAYDDHFLTSVAGDGLDEWGHQQMLDLERNSGESHEDYRVRLLAKLRSQNKALSLEAWEEAVYAAIGAYPLHIGLHYRHTGQREEFLHVADPFGWRWGGDPWNRQSATIVLPTGLTEDDLDDIETELRIVKRQSEKLLLAEIDEETNVALASGGAVASAVGEDIGNEAPLAIDSLPGGGDPDKSWLYTSAPGSGTWWKVALTGWKIIRKVGLQQSAKAGVYTIKDVRLVFGDGSTLDWTLEDVGDPPPPLKNPEYRWLDTPLLTDAITVYILSAYNTATKVGIGEFEALVVTLTPRRVLI